MTPTTVVTLVLIALGLAIFAALCAGEVRRRQILGARAAYRLRHAEAIQLGEALRDGPRSDATEACPALDPGETALQTPGSAPTPAPGIAGSVTSEPVITPAARSATASPVVSSVTAPSGPAPGPDGDAPLAAIPKPRDPAAGLVEGVEDLAVEDPARFGELVRLLIDRSEGPGGTAEPAPAPTAEAAAAR